MTFKRDMCLRGEIFRAGSYVRISKEQYDAIKDWVEHKTIKNYAHVCIHLFNRHGIFYIPYKIVKVFWHTYVDGFYKAIGTNEIAEEGTDK